MKNLKRWCSARLSTADLLRFCNYFSIVSWELQLISLTEQPSTLKTMGKNVFEPTNMMIQQNSTHIDHELN